MRKIFKTKELSEVDAEAFRKALVRLIPLYLVSLLLLVLWIATKFLVHHYVSASIFGLLLLLLFLLSRSLSSLISRRFPVVRRHPLLTSLTLIVLIPFVPMAFPALILTGIKESEKPKSSFVKTTLILSLLNFLLTSSLHNPLSYKHLASNLGAGNAYIFTVLSEFYEIKTISKKVKAKGCASINCYKAFHDQELRDKDYSSTGKILSLAVTARELANINKRNKFDHLGKKEFKSIMRDQGVAFFERQSIYMMMGLNLIISPLDFLTASLIHVIDETTTAKVIMSLHEKTGDSLNNTEKLSYYRGIASLMSTERPLED